MQQIFPCPTCGAQNFIGQEFCQVCGQRFQYNCPHCGAIVDATLVNCPGCRQSLFWPTPQRVKPFPKQTVTYQRTGGGGEEGAKPKQKSDPWLTGCLGLVIIAFLVLGAYFVYDNFIKKPPSVLPDETGFRQMQSPELETLQGVNTIVYHVNETQKWL
jgi:hypothetical protein